jgi:hypothetical protein
MNSSHATRDQTGIFFPLCVRVAVGSGASPRPIAAINCPVVSKSKKLAVRSARISAGHSPAGGLAGRDRIVKSRSRPSLRVSAANRSLIKIIGKNAHIFCCACPRLQRKWHSIKIRRLIYKVVFNNQLNAPSFKGYKGLPPGSLKTMTVVSRNVHRLRHFGLRHVVPINAVLARSYRGRGAIQ